MEDQGRAPARVLLLPGWLNSGAAHWQSRWEVLHGHRRVEQADWQWPRRGDWLARLDEVLLEADDPVCLAAHSLGCHLVAAWATHSSHTARVRGALLVAPPDLEHADAPPPVSRWQPTVRRRLPFPATLVHSDDDPYCSPAQARDLASAWGAETVGLQGAGHINGVSGLADWPAGLALLQRLGGA